MITHRTKLFVSWLYEWRMFYLAILYVLLGFSIIYLCGFTEKSIRLIGLALQLLGVGTVIWGISTTRRQFGHPPLFSLFKQWINRCPLLNRGAYLQPDALSIGVTVSDIRLTTVFTPKPELTVEQRLTHIESGLVNFQNQLDQTESKIDEVSNTADGKFIAEMRAREASTNQVMTVLEESSTGGIAISAVGSLWLLVGVTLSTASQELAKYL